MTRNERILFYVMAVGNYHLLEYMQRDICFRKDIMENLRLGKKHIEKSIKSYEKREDYKELWTNGGDIETEDAKVLKSKLKRKLQSAAIDIEIYTVDLKEFEHISVIYSVLFQMKECLENMKSLKQPLTTHMKNAVTNLEKFTNGFLEVAKI